MASPKARLSEDWLVVWLGVLLLGAVLVGWRPPIPTVKWATQAELLSHVLAAHNLAHAAAIGIVYLLLSGAGFWVLAGRLSRYALGFPLVFALGWLAQVASGHAEVSHWGLEYVIFALLFGLLISNLLGVPDWLRDAVRTEYYIKVGLVMLGASIVFREILQAGVRGLAQALLVVVAVWYVGFWLARRLRVDEEFAAMLATAVSICGVSAAIAACGAIQGDKKKLSYVTSLVLVCAVPMMILMPWLAKAWGLPDLVAGAWIGGVIDTSGAVVAAGALVSEAALKSSVIVKFSQNVLIGVAAFCLSLWWTLRRGRQGGTRPSAWVIWERFPKFVLGFLAASVVFSFLLDPALVSATKAPLKGLQTIWFAMAFVCIGLETRLAELLKLEEGRPVVAFLGAQTFNTVWTLAIAVVLFGGLVLPLPALD